MGIYTEDEAREIAESQYQPINITPPRPSLPAQTPTDSIMQALSTPEDEPPKPPNGGGAPAPGNGVEKAAETPEGGTPSTNAGAASPPSPVPEGGTPKTIDQIHARTAAVWIREATNPDVLHSFTDQENEREGGARPGVLHAIGKRLEDLAGHHREPDQDPAADPPLESMEPQDPEVEPIAEPPFVVDGSVATPLPENIPACLIEGSFENEVFQELNFRFQRIGEAPDGLKLSWQHNGPRWEKQATNPGQFEWLMQVRKHFFERQSG